MVITIIILSVLLIGSFIALHKLQTRNVNEHAQLQSEKDELDKLKENYKLKLKMVKDVVYSTYRVGYYKMSLTQSIIKRQFDVKVHIKEIDRYTNGESRIEYDHITLKNCPMEKKDVEEFVIKNFQELKPSNEIEWLESVNEIQHERENKLKRILKENL